MEKPKQITEQSHSIPVAGEADVIVVGGGVAGVAAAVSAARNGSRVILLEKSIILGGLATLGHVCIYLPLDDGLGHKVYGGLAEELLHGELSVALGIPKDEVREYIRQRVKAAEAAE